MRQNVKWLVTTHAIDRWNQRILVAIFDKNKNDELAREQLLEKAQKSTLIDRASNGHLILLHVLRINSKKSVQVFFVISTEIQGAFRIITIFTKSQFQDHANYDPRLDVLEFPKVTLRLKNLTEEVKLKQNEKTEPKNIEPKEIEPEIRNPKPPGGWVYKVFATNVLDILVSTRNINDIYRLVFECFPERFDNLVNLKRLSRQIVSGYVHPILCENLETDIV